MFVITGATGRTGSVAAEALLSAGKSVRAVVRSASKAERLKALGAEVFVADLGDPAALGRAVRGLDAVVPTFTSFGASENIAVLFRDLYAAIAEGKLVSEPGERLRGTTSLEATLRTLLPEG
jgi:uncharacterized protein YbjT (DUF2867 family)